MVSSSAARTAQRWAASRRLSFKTGLVISDAKAQATLGVLATSFRSSWLRPRNRTYLSKVRRAVVRPENKCLLLRAR